MDIEALKARIQERMRVLGLNPNSAAETAGLNRDYVRTILRGKSHAPSAERLTRLAQALQCSVEWLASGDEEHEPSTGAAPASLATRGSPSPRDATPLPPSNADLTRAQTTGLVGGVDFPIYASAEGGTDGQMLLSFEPIEYVRRPGILDGVPGAFGIYVVGDSMDPAYVPGDMALVHPRKPPVRGDDVLVVLCDGNGEHRALIKRYLGRAGGRILLMQHSPRRDDLSYPESEVAQMLLIVGKYAARR